MPELNYIAHPCERGVLFCFNTLTIKQLHVMTIENNQQQINKELKIMDQRLYDLEEKITSIDGKLTQVVDAILGNPLTKSGGFVDEFKVMKEKIDKLENKVEKQEEFRRRIGWTVGLIVAALILIEQFGRIYKSFF